MLDPSKAFVLSRQSVLSLSLLVIAVGSSLLISRMRTPEVLASEPPLSAGLPGPSTFLRTTDEAELRKLEDNLSKAVRARDRRAIPFAMSALARADGARAATVIPSAYADLELGGSLDEEFRQMALQGAVQALSSIVEPKELAVLPRIAKKSKRWPERLVAVRALVERARLGFEKFDTSEKVAIRALNDERPEVVVAAAGFLEEQRSRTGMEPLARAMERWEDRVFNASFDTPTGVRSVDISSWAWNACARALYQLTGVPCRSAKEYRAFLKSNRKRLDPKSIDLEAIEAAEANSRTGRNLFGLPVTGRRIAFVVDVSGSMEQSDPPTAKDLSELERAGSGKRDEVATAIAERRRRMVRARLALQSAIRALGDDERFNVIAYSTEVDPFKSSLVTATSDNKKQAIEFVGALEPRGVTATDDALFRAFIDPEVDTIYLITDGAPTHEPSRSGGELPPDSKRIMAQILSDTARMNLLRRCRIFTLGFEGAEEEFLEKLAKEHGGRYERIE